MPFVKKVVKALKKTLEEEKLAREKVAGSAESSEDESKECISVPTKTGINNVISKFWKTAIDHYSKRQYLRDYISNGVDGYCSAFSYGLDTSSSQFKNIDDMKKEVNKQISIFIKHMYDKQGGVSLNKLLSTVNGYLDDNWTMSFSSITPISSHSTTTAKKRDDASQKDKKRFSYRALVKNLKDDPLLISQLSINTAGNLTTLGTEIAKKNSDGLSIIGTVLGFVGWTALVAHSSQPKCGNGSRPCQPGCGGSCYDNWGN